MIGYVPLGMDDEYVGQYCPGVLPDIQGSLTPILVFGDTTDAKGCFKSSENPMVNMRTGSEIASFGGASIKLKASDYNSIYSQYNWFSGERVIPASLGVKYIVKY